MCVCEGVNVCVRGQCVCEGGNVCVCVDGMQGKPVRDHAVEWVGETIARMWPVNTLTSRTGSGPLRGHIFTLT